MNGELFWLKMIHQHFSAEEKIEAIQEHPILKFIEQKLPLKVNLVNWNSPQPLKYYFPALSDPKNQPKNPQTGSKRPKSPASRISRRAADPQAPEFYVHKSYTAEEDIIVCHQRAAVLRAYKHKKGRLNRSHRVESVEMLDELQTRCQNKPNNARIFQEAKQMPLDSVIEQLELLHKELKAEIAKGSSKLLENIRAEGGIQSDKIIIDGLEYLDMNTPKSLDSGKVAPKKKQISHNTAGVLESYLQKSSIRPFSLTADEEDFIMLVEAKKISSSRQPQSLSRNRVQNVFLAPKLNGSGNAFHKPNDSTSFRNPSDAFICQICNTAEDDEENPIFFCSKCSITVHKACYRMTEVPREHEDWTCQLCKTFGAKGRLLSCALCTRRGGALFPSTMKTNDPFLQKVRSCNSSRRNVNSASRVSEYEIDVSSRPLIGSERVLQAIEADRVKDPRFYEKLDYNYNLEPHEYTAAELREEPVTDTAWVHWTCGFWVPGLDFNWESRLIYKIDEIDTYRFQLQCRLCAQSNL